VTKVGHVGVATVPAVNLAGAVQTFLPETRPAMVLVALVLVLATCTVNDWDHPRFAKRSHPGAALVRWSARIGYAWHTAADERAWERDKAWKLRTGIDWDPNDMHRGPSHCLEWCAGLGMVTWVATAAALPNAADECWLLGLAVFTGTASHVLADACTPSGVPVSAIYNWAVHRQVWRRHALGWRVPLAHVVVPVRLGFARRDVPVMSWVRWPEVVAVGERVGARQVRAGLFYTDEATDQYVIIPVMVMAAVVCGLAWAGELAPTMAALTGWSG
jgi:hypothetical protein